MTYTLANVDAADLGPPVPRPRNVFAIGLNYQAHADEGSMDVPDNPLVSYLSRVTTLATGDLIFTGTLSNRCVRTTDHRVC